MVRSLFCALIAVTTFLCMVNTADAKVYALIFKTTGGQMYETDSSGYVEWDKDGNQCSLPMGHFFSDKKGTLYYSQPTKAPWWFYDSFEEAWMPGYKEDDSYVHAKEPEDTESSWIDYHFLADYLLDAPKRHHPLAGKARLFKVEGLSPCLAKDLEERLEGQSKEDREKLLSLLSITVDEVDEPEKLSFLIEGKWGDDSLRDADLSAGSSLGWYVRKLAIKKMGLGFKPTR